MLQVSTDFEEVLSFLEARQCLAGPRGANVLLQLGYFDAPAGATAAPLDEFALLTCHLGLELANQLKQRWRGTRVQFCTLVNDLGQSCGSEAAVCTIAQAGDFGGPSATAQAMQAQIVGTLREADVPAAHHAFFFERNLRNRGLRLVKAGLSSQHPRLSRVEDDDGSAQIFLRGQGLQKILVATQQGDALTGKCPVILGAFYRDAVTLLRHRFSQDTRPTLVIDLCHLVDRDKVLRGIEVARLLGQEGMPAPANAGGATHLVPLFLDGAGEDFFPHCAPFQE